MLPLYLNINYYKVMESYAFRYFGIIQLLKPNIEHPKYNQHISELRGILEVT